MFSKIMKRIIIPALSNRTLPSYYGYFFKILIVHYCAVALGEWYSLHA